MTFARVAKGWWLASTIIKEALRQATSFFASLPPSSDWFPAVKWTKALFQGHNSHIGQSFNSALIWIKKLPTSLVSFFSFSFYLSLARSFFLPFFLFCQKTVPLSFFYRLHWCTPLFVSENSLRKDQVSCFSLVQHVFNLLSPPVWSVDSGWHFVDYSGRYWGDARVTKLRRKRERQVFLVLVR